MYFNGKTILITGASSGIGKELTKQLSKLNCTLHILARRNDLLDNLKNKLAQTNHNIYTYKCDITNKEDIQNTFEQIFSVNSNIDIAILNAGTSFRSDITKFNSDEAHNVFKVNVMGIVYCVEQLVPKMIEMKKGTIVGVSSLADSRGFAKSGVYCASKAAATRFLESLRVELSGFGIKVLTVKPGFVRTAMTDKNKFKMPLLMDADKAVKIILNGIKKGKRIIQFPLPTVFGSKLIGALPVWLYDFFAEKSKIK